MAQSAIMHKKKWDVVIFSIPAATPPPAPEPITTASQSSTVDWWIGSGEKMRGGAGLGNGGGPMYLIDKKREHYRDTYDAEMRKLQRREWSCVQAQRQSLNSPKGKKHVLHRVPVRIAFPIRQRRVEAERGKFAQTHESFAQRTQARVRPAQQDGLARRRSQRGEATPMTACGKTKSQSIKSEYERD